MDPDFGTFIKDGVVRPAHDIEDAVYMRFDGWRPHDAATVAAAADPHRTDTQAPAPAGADAPAEPAAAQPAELPAEPAAEPAAEPFAEPADEPAQ